MLLIGITTVLLSALSVFDCRAQSLGTCETGSATDTLDINNVRAALFNTGGLFWSDEDNTYTVPKVGNANSIFASGIWIGGLDNASELRFAGTTYGPFEFWPGPIDENGNPPVDCSRYDRIFKVSLVDLFAYESSGTLTDDLRDWPVQWGAPVIDGDGIKGNYDLNAGDRPDITGDQMAWWVMNDVGGRKKWSQTEPIGLEVQVSSFAFATDDPVNNTTFYKYHLENKGSENLTDVYFGMWADPDLGYSADDFIGSDSSLGLAIVYNADNYDEGPDGYAEGPPAIGYDFVQGPHLHATGERRQMDVFIDTRNNSSIPEPSNDGYGYMRALWRDGTRMTFGGSGYGGTTPTNFMFPGNAASYEYWSEMNTDGSGKRNTPSDRQFVMSTGPFNFPSGSVQEIVVAIIWSHSQSNLSSFTKLRLDDIYVQEWYDQKFTDPIKIDAPTLTGTTIDNGVILQWSNRPFSNNYLESFDAQSYSIVQKPFTDDETHSFEGYIVYEFESSEDSVGQVIAVYDVENEVTGAADFTMHPVTGQLEEVITILGGDSGVRRSHFVDSLHNYQDYHFGVQAYAYNHNSYNRVRRSAIARVTATPGPTEQLQGGTVAQVGIGDTVAVRRTAGAGTESSIYGVVDNPLAVLPDQYEVRFYDHEVLFAGTDSAETELMYDIIRLSDDSVFFNGGARFDSTGLLPSFSENAFSLDGMSLTITSADPSFTEFVAVANGGGELIPRTGAAADFQGFPAPQSPTDRQQVGQGKWFVHTGDNGSRGPYDAFIQRSIRNGFGPVVPFDWEVRFTEDCYNAWRTATDARTPFATPLDGCYGYDRYGIFGDDRPQLVPFELWNIGIGTPDDSSDDFRVIPAIIDWDGDGYDMQWFDHSVSSADNDPETDWTYWYNPLDRTPGTAGYDNWQNDLLSGIDAHSHDNEIMARFVWVNWNGGSVSAATDKADFLANVVNQDMPEPGTVFRLTTTKPLSDGDVFQLSTVDAAPLTNETSVANSALERIGISPNPYYGISDYEKGLVDTEVRFTNMPDKATIRVFTLAGSLVRTLEKNDNNSFLSFDLRNEYGNWLASGMYLIHVEVPGVGERTLKFGLIQRNKALQ